MGITSVWMEGLRKESQKVRQRGSKKTKRTRCHGGSKEREKQAEIPVKSKHQNIGIRDSIKLLVHVGLSYTGQGYYTYSGEIFVKVNSILSLICQFPSVG